jgi:cyclopropane fatty-acyl-phospholipid synthase-like methyltransferase
LSEPQQACVSEVLARLHVAAPDATVLDVGCGTGRVTEELLALDASAETVTLARARRDRARPAALALPPSFHSPHRFRQIA